jgi:D-alanyl-D-alanine carboxypeptidase/D-alanyl-D-alanine-endopeptidase (penicillin-binding protein 4)
MPPRYRFLFLAAALGVLAGCSLSRRVSREAGRHILSLPPLRHAYVGVCVYDAGKGKYVYLHDAHKYFTPASNTKLYTFYTGLSLLGDSTTGIRYQINGDTLYVSGTGDPSLLHPDFAVQPAFDFLKKTTLPIVLTSPANENTPFGAGWPWDDYNADYQPERSAMPLYGNVARFTVRDHRLQVTPSWFARGKLVADSAIRARSFYVVRDEDSNVFRYHVVATADSGVQEVPFLVQDGRTAASLLADTLHKPVLFEPGRQLPGGWKYVRNVPLDSLFRHMMYRSDNFYAEQTLMMASMKTFDTISSARMISRMLQDSLGDLPDPPRWVDGSGLSRYNLFSPADMVEVLKKLQEDFPAARIDSMLPTGGRGTLRHLYLDMGGSIFAKTGSLSNNVSLSGYLFTRHGHRLVFSILVNHCLCPLGQVRLAMQSFLHRLWETY